MNNVFILNKIIDGSWNEIEGNISHEIIDFILTDYGKYYVYNIPYGSCPDWITVSDEQGSEDHCRMRNQTEKDAETHDKTDHF